MSLPRDFIGVGVAERRSDVFHLSRRRARIDITRTALRRFARKAAGALVIRKSETEQK